MDGVDLYTVHIESDAVHIKPDMDEIDLDTAHVELDMSRVELDTDGIPRASARGLFCLTWKTCG